MVGAREIWAELASAGRGALPRRCLCCRHLIDGEPERWELCRRCGRELDLSPAYPLLGDGIDGGFAAAPYAGVARDLVAALKFSRLLPAADLCATVMLSRAPAALLAGTIVSVPASPVRFLVRGFDPAEEIAIRLAGSTDLACDTSVLRRRDLRRQRGHGRQVRLAGPPVVRAARPIEGEVLLVDDVSTTGATLDACARALRLAGATRVRAIVFATVPPPSRKFR